MFQFINPSNKHIYFPQTSFSKISPVNIILSLARHSKIKGKFSRRDEIGGEKKVFWQPLPVVALSQTWSFSNGHDEAVGENDSSSYQIHKETFITWRVSEINFSISNSSWKMTRKWESCRKCKIHLLLNSIKGKTYWFLAKWIWYVSSCVLRYIIQRQTEAYRIFWRMEERFWCDILFIILFLSLLSR